MVNLVEDEKAFQPSNAIGYRRHLKHCSATPSSIELAQLGPSEVATRGGFCENDAMYQAPDLLPKSIYLMYHPECNVNVRFFFWLSIPWTAPIITSNIGLCKGEVDKMEGLMSEKTFVLPLLEPCQINAENSIEKAL